MKEKIRNTFPKVYRNLKFLFWKSEAYRLRQQYKRIEGSFADSINGRIIVLIPHADDEIIGCFSLLFSNDNVLLVYMNRSGDDSVKRHAERYNELSRIVRMCNKKMEVYIDDVWLHRKIMDFRPDYICVPCLFDWHPEHFEVIEELRKAISHINEVDKNFQIIMYQESVPIPVSIITHIIPFTKEIWNRKWSIFVDVYKTQLYIPYKRFGLNERINGSLINAYAAETYSVIDCLGWEKLLTNEMLNDDEKNQLRESLGSLRHIRAVLNRILSSHNH